MCGRFAQIEPVDVIAQRLQVDEVLVKNTAPRYNVSPGQDVVALVHSTNKRLVEFRWGLIPYWVKDPSTFKPLINARVETVVQKPSFKKAFLHTRCILPASGFYEWKKEGTQKIPYYITADEFFGFAGIYDSVSINGTLVQTCAILTTQANDQMSSIHNRMPVIVRQSDFNQWIDNQTTLEEITKLMQPFDSKLIIYRVSTKVNNPAYNGADCITPM